MLSDILSTNNNDISIPMNLHQILSKINHNNSSTTSHTSQIKAPNVASQFILINNHSKEWGRWIKQTTIDKKNANILKVDIGISK